MPRASYDAPGFATQGTKGQPQKQAARPCSAALPSVAQRFPPSAAPTADPGCVPLSLVSSQRGLAPLRPAHPRSSRDDSADAARLALPDRKDRQLLHGENAMSVAPRSAPESARRQHQCLRREPGIHCWWSNPSPWLSARTSAYLRQSMPLQARGMKKMCVKQLVDCLCWQPAQLPERTGKEYHQQSDEEDDPEAAGETYRHSRKYKELSEAGQIGCPILTIVSLP